MMNFLLGGLVTILVIIYLIYGFFSVLGNSSNPASWTIILIMKITSWIKKLWKGK